MRSLFEKKPWLLLISVLALVAITMLASGLGHVPFHTAQPIGRSAQKRGGFDASGVIDSWMQIPIWMQVGVWLAIILLVILIGLLLSPEVRKLLFRMVLRVIITYWVLFFLFKRYGNEFALNALSFLNPTSDAPVPDSSNIPPPVFTPTTNMLWVSYLLSFFIVLIAVFISWRVYVFWGKLRELDDKKPLDEIAKIARSSIQDLSSGRDTTDVIMNCYFRMSDAVADRRNLQRRESMTPGEFALRLEQAGLPGDAVKRLTRLFEAVRYGEHRAGQNDINEAISCLNTVLASCGESS